MAKAKENQTTNLRMAYCGCTENGVKHNIPVPKGQGYIVRTQSNDYKVYCKECYEKITKATNLNLKIAEEKVATLQGSTEEKATIKENWSHTFQFYINNKDVEIINLLKRLHFTITKGTKYTVKAISGKETNLNGLQKNFRNLVNNFNFKDDTKVTIITYKDDIKVSTTKETLMNAIEKAKEERKAL